MIALLLVTLGCGSGAPSTPPPPTAEPPAPPRQPAPPAHPVGVAPPCPDAMVGIAGGPATLGEGDATRARKYQPNTVVPRGPYDVQGFCIDRFPLPGSAGDAWATDGLGRAAIRDRVEPWLWAQGRRLCTVAELMRAAGGPDGRRYPWGEEHALDVCDARDEAPAVMGSYSGCVSPDGIADLQVRSTWARLDDTTRARLTAAGAHMQPGFDGGYAVWGGLVRDDTYYAPTNFGVHFHQDSAPAFNDDGLRTCAWPGAVTTPAYTAAVARLRSRRLLGELGQ